MDRAVTALIFDLLTPEVWEQMRSQGKKADNSAVVRLRAQLKTLRGMWLDGQKDDDEWDDAQADVRERIAEIESAEVLVLPDIDDVQSSWPGLDVEAQRLIIAATIRRVTIMPFGPGAKGLERIKIDRAI